MSKIISREIRLVRRPVGLPGQENFDLVKVELPSAQDGQVLVRNLFMSVDPYMRGRMNDLKSYVPPFQINQPLEGGAIGEVIESRTPELKPGDIVTSNFGWREYFLAPAKALRQVQRDVEPLSVYLGALGMTGMTAWCGLQMSELKSGEVIYISAAAGAVGTVVGQLAKARGASVIGSAGSKEKVRFLLEESGFDAAFNYREGSIYDQLKAAVPTGIDVYFDNVGADTLEAAISALRVHGRVIACGSITVYNDEKPRPGPRNLFHITTKRLTIKGLLVLDWLNRWPEFEKEAGGLYRAGKLKHKETVVYGLDKAVEAFLGLFQGNNLGKMIVKLG